MKQTLAPNNTVPVALVSGLPRSGTTLLMLMLDSHPTGIMPRGRVLQFTSHRWKNGVPDESALNAFLTDLYHSDYIHRPPRSKQSELHSKLTSHLPLTYEQLIQQINFHDALITAGEASFWGEKTSRLIWSWDLLKNVLTNPRLILVVRDGRAILSSLLNANKSTGLEIDVIQWASDYNRFCQAVERLRSQPNVMIIRYEDLVTNTVPILQSLCRFLTIDFCSEMLSYTSKASRFDGDPKNSLHRLIEQKPDSSRETAWQNEMPAYICRIADYLIRPSLSIWNYPELPMPLMRPPIIVALNILCYRLSIKFFLILKYKLHIDTPHWLYRRARKLVGY